MTRAEIGSVAVALALTASAAFFVALQVSSIAVSLGERYLERRRPR
ncbi:hypothetical protein [Rhodococcus sp. 14-2470-1a]|nr:hypothetical protein [Rhodococcus sp. 14-2470-1a]